MKRVSKKPAGNLGCRAKPPTIVTGIHKPALSAKSDVPTGLWGRIVAFFRKLNLG